MRSVRKTVACGVLIGNGILLLLAGLLALWKSFVPAAFSQCAVVGLWQIYCPICGGTRAFFSFLSLRWLQVLRYYPPLFFLAALYLELHLRAILAIRSNRLSVLRFHWHWVWLPLAAVLFWFLLRNALLLGFQIDITGDLLWIIPQFFR